MRPLRNRSPEAYRLITIRTAEARLWITPNQDVRELIGGIIARYQEIFQVIIYAYCFLGNHYHMLIKAPLCNADEFCENVNREIARRLNFLHKRQGPFWGRRYDDQEILSEIDLLEAFLYILTNPAHHGLVADSSQWPGLNSYEHVLTGQDKVFSFLHHSRSEDEGKITSHKLKITPLPQHAHLSEESRSELVRELLAQRASQIRDERRQSGQRFLGLRRIGAQIAGAAPVNVSRSPRPLCYTCDTEKRREFRLQYRYLRKLYDNASFRYRLGDLSTEFPEHTFKPPLHRAPRVVPFKPLTPADVRRAA